MSKGTCFIAINNKELDYIRFAMFASQQVKKHFKEHKKTALITTQPDYEYFTSTYPVKDIKSVFDYIIIDDHTYTDENMRTHFDTPWTEFDAPFHNRQKHDIYWLSPFDQTLLLDIDYIVQTNHLEYMFSEENTSNLQMFNKARYLCYDSPAFPERWLHPNGIPMWWSTVVYFKKSPEAKMFFELWSHIADNYDYYKFLYGFSGSLFRTDFCVSIALHILNGMQHGDFAEPIVGSMLNMDQKDVIIQSKSPENMHFLAYNRDEPWKNLLVHNEKHDVHCMNKRNLNEIIAGYSVA